MFRHYLIKFLKLSSFSNFVLLNFKFSSICKHMNNCIHFYDHFIWKLFFSSRKFGIARTRQHVSFSAYSGRLVAGSTSFYTAFYTYSRHSMHFLIAAWISVRLVTIILCDFHLMLRF
jgi:hypothetical protein